MRGARALELCARYFDLREAYDLWNQGLRETCRLEGGSVGTHREEMQRAQLRARAAVRQALEDGGSPA